MSLKFFITFLFLIIIQSTHGQNLTFFGLHFPFFGGTTTKSSMTNTTILMDQTQQPLANETMSNATVPMTVLNDMADTQSDELHHTTGQIVNMTKPTNNTTKTQGWNYFFPSIDFNGLPTRIVKTHPDLKKIGLVFINRKHCNDISHHHKCSYTQTRYGVNDTKQLIGNADFDVNRKTVIYFHGYEEYIESEATQTIIDAYLQRNDHNLLVCDYRELVAGKYLTHAVANIQLMAPAMAKMIYKLNSRGLNHLLIHLVGHSIGAQMAGSVGKAFMELTEGTKLLARITGLDPAFLFFYPPIGRHITAQDAYFVDIIHVDAWVYGAPVATGSVDFWPNGGSNTQPGCPPRDRKILSKLDSCSHYRAIRFWIESLLTENAFLALKCPSYYKFKKNACFPKSTAYMGYDAKPGITGNYYLQTNGQEPFSRKHHGIINDPVDQY